MDFPNRMLHTVNPELVFELIRDDLGHFTARCLSMGITARGADLNELHDNVTAAIAECYPEDTPPSAEAIHFIMFPQD